ncbi:MAG TPA: hypothetical protein VFC67_01670 [Prolixibacteraceae bacterium]|nr:hypothetical protein [Prolixibacteraceae bacterium]
MCCFKRTDQRIIGCAAEISRCVGGWGGGSEQILVFFYYFGWETEWKTRSQLPKKITAGVEAERLSLLLILKLNYLRFLKYEWIHEG